MDKWPHPCVCLTKEQDCGNSLLLFGGRELSGHWPCSCARPSRSKAWPSLRVRESPSLTLSSLEHAECRPYPRSLTLRVQCVLLTVTEHQGQGTSWSPRADSGQAAPVLGSGFFSRVSIWRGRSASKSLWGFLPALKSKVLSFSFWSLEKSLFPSLPRKDSHCSVSLPEWSILETPVGHDGKILGKHSENWHS